MEDRYLYRAKRKSDKKWIYGNLIQTDDGVYIIQNYVPKHLIGKYDVDPSTICQYTCLKDRNGKLIWEGDIILFQRDNDDCPFTNKDTKKRLGKVFYKGFRTTFAIGMGKNGSGSINDDLWKYVQNGNRVEVIGNIFDNPELLEV